MPTTSTDTRQTDEVMQTHLLFFITCFVFINLFVLSASRWEQILKFCHKGLLCLPLPPLLTIKALQASNTSFPSSIFSLFSTKGCNDFRHQRSSHRASSLEIFSFYVVAGLQHHKKRTKIHTYLDKVIVTSLNFDIILKIFIFHYLLCTS